MVILPKSSPEWKKSLANPRVWNFLSRLPEINAGALGAACRQFFIPEF
jgi:hypothetical protein